MSQRFRAICGTIFGLFVLCATPALADIDAVNVAVNCNAYSLSVSASGLTPGVNYEIDYTIDSSPFAAGLPITGSIPFTASSATFTGTLMGSFPALNGNFSFSGTAAMPGHNPVSINFLPTSLTCGAPPPQVCTAQSINSSNFNGTSIQPGDWVWFNANFTAKGIPSTGATITFTNSTITATGSGTPFTSSAPNAQITFSPSASCSSTTFNAMTNTWVTTVPVKGDDEIFLTGLAVPVPSYGLPDGSKVDWTGTFSSNGVQGISIQWKWGAAVYSSFTGDYNALAAKPGHQAACGQSGKGNGDHAGTPEGVNNNNQPWKQFVTGGARGGGGSNWTGSWSSTQTVSPACTNSGSGYPYK